MRTALVPSVLPIIAGCDSGQDQTLKAPEMVEKLIANAAARLHPLIVVEKREKATG